MWVEAKTQNEFDLHNIGSPKLPKEGNFAGNGNFWYENSKLMQLGGECITTYDLVFVKDRRGPKYASSGKSCRLRPGKVGHYARVMSKNADSAIRDLYPDFSEKEVAEAVDNLDRYLVLVLRIFERVESETDPQAARLTSGAGTLGSNSPQSSA